MTADPRLAAALAALPPADTDADLASAIAVIAEAASEMTDSRREGLRATIDAALRAARAARFDRRDALIRELLETRFGHGALCGRCKRLAESWIEHVTRRTDDPELQRLTALNGGKTIGHGQLKNIAEGHRAETY
ncbi:MAG: hypothetical protein ACR652_10230 [Methylocystis sp.]|uniref:hypothetical protein n=1 Tax=Methylocystis sp. TaxID=1911079 RepID=UPI003DA437C6